MLAFTVFCLHSIFLSLGGECPADSGPAERENLSTEYFISSDSQSERMWLCTSTKANLFTRGVHAPMAEGYNSWCVCVCVCV